MKEERLYPYSPGHREVETSIEAAEAIKEGVETIRNKVFNVILNKGNFGATADEVAELLNFSPFTVRPRVTELFKLDKIERKDKRKNLSQKSAYVYVVSKAYVNNQYTTKGI
jgi:transcription initiation factor IIE alpha subunit|tara:strand:- start:302 stop:637 length:336 start_codon:yes stop_codon:yes gene_type:complete